METRPQYWPADGRHAGDLAGDDFFEASSGNRRYVDVRGFDFTDLRDVLAVERAATVGRRLVEVDLADALQDWPELVGLDPGIVAAVVALSAMSCVPATSCNGEPDHQYDRPTVAFWGDTLSVRAVERPAAEADCELVPGGRNTLLLRGASIEQMHRFAQRAMDLGTASQSTGDGCPNRRSTP